MPILQEIVESNNVVNNFNESYTDDETMSVIDDDDDDNMANPYNVESGSDDTDDDLDEEDDEIYWKVNISLDLFFYLSFFLKSY